MSSGYGSAKLQQLQLSSWLSQTTPALSAVTLMHGCNFDAIFGPLLTAWLMIDTRLRTMHAPRGMLCAPGAYGTLVCASDPM